MSEPKMRAKLERLLALYQEAEAAGESAVLTLSTKGGKSNIKIEMESGAAPRVKS